MKIEVNGSHKVLLSSTKEENPFDIDCRELKHSSPMQSVKPQGWGAIITLIAITGKALSLILGCPDPK